MHVGFYIVKYHDDGVIKVLNEDEIEFFDSIPPAGRNLDDFREGDQLMARWEDGELYDATVLKSGGMLFDNYYTRNVLFIIINFYRFNGEHEKAVD